MESHSSPESPSALRSANDIPAECDALLPPSSPIVSPDPSTSKHCISIRTTCIIALGMISVSSSLLAAPLERLYESVICKNYYLSHDPSKIEHDGTVREGECKRASIQGDLGIFLTHQMLINVVPNLVASIYTGILAKRWGRKFMLVLNLGSQVSSLLWKIFLLGFGMPIKLTWTSSIFLLVGAGPEMRTESIFMIITDATPQNRRFNIYTLGQVCTLMASVASTILASYLMKINNWIPLVIGITVLFATMCFIIVFIPDDSVSASGHIADENSALDGSGSINQAQSSDSLLTWYKVLRKTVEDRYHFIWHQIKEIFHFICSSRNISLLVVTFLVSSTFPQLMDGGVFLQYVSVRLGWTFAKASQLQALSFGLNLVVLIISYVSIKTKPIILIISRTSAICQSLGFLILGISASLSPLLLGLLICAAGQPLRMSIRTTLSSMTQGKKDNITDLFTAITLMDVIGGPMINYLLAFSFKEGLRLGDSYIGLPFFAAAVLLGMTALVVLFVNDSS